MSAYGPRQAIGQWPTDEGGATGQRVNWWLRLTSSGWDRPQVTIEQRERARRSRLTSWIILGLLVGDLVLLPIGLTDMPTLIMSLVVTAGFLVAAVLNRLGFVTAAGSVLILLIITGLMSVVIGASADPVINAPAGQLGLDALPAYDLLAVAVVVAASILPRAAAFVVAGLNIALISLDFYLQPRAADLQRYITAQGALPQLVRPVALQVIIAVVAYLWVRGTDTAIRRADRAEEVATMEHQLAEQKRQLDIGIHQILETHVRVANGDFGARAPLTQDNVLFQIAASLNNLLNRLGRAGQAEYFYQRTVAEIDRLRQSLMAAKAGRPPLWPAPSGTPVDGLIEIIAGPGGTPTQGQLPPMYPTSGLRGIPGSPSRPAGHGASSNPFAASGMAYPPGAFPPGPDMPVPGSGPASRPHEWQPGPGGWSERVPSADPPDAESSSPWGMPPFPEWQASGDPGAGH